MKNSARQEELCPNGAAGIKKAWKAPWVGRLGVDNTLGILKYAQPEVVLTASYINVKSDCPGDATGAPVINAGYCRPDES